MIFMIAAVGEGMVIGKDGDMPWHLPNDLKYFKRTTSGHPVLMGKRTFESIGKALPNRRNIILTRDKSFSAEDIEVVNSLDEVKELLELNNSRTDGKKEQFFVIGGATLYNQLIGIADRLYITKIHAHFEGDTYFPEINEEEWKVVSSEKGEVDEKNPYRHTFVVYERRTK
ncbi:dihydrofolate reductase [Evansella tamaricis]|uniref:Dihydrofolate reductase n=1 Tax=Evansella tamaricis TaxID=2069301 RepID=A0ABS6JH53_9BACI|nr:dihydrofolate reductase [Evansella tamaricis]MBU9712994.1 dihydrofolate reductase [Evansella tamaricis]